MYAMYLRKSRTEDKDIPLEKILKNHYNMLMELADKLNIQVREENIYRELETGDSISIRPKMQELLEKVSKGTYKGVLCTELTRLCRGSKMDQEIVATTFATGECKIITIGKTYDLENEFDEEMVDFGLFMSRREYKTITKRMQRGREQSVKQGKYIGSILPYGYNKQKLDGENGFKLVINEEEAHVIRLIFKWFLEDNVGASIIAKRLNQRGYVPKKGKQWTYNSVKNILTNKVVAGYLKHNERKYKKHIDTTGNLKKSRPVNQNAEYYKGLHEAIIPLKDFEKVQEILQTRKQHKSNFDLPLSNPLAGIVKCSECGRVMVKRPLPNCKPQLYCPTSGCKNMGSYLYRVEESILQAVSDSLQDYKYYLDNYEYEKLKEKRNVDKDLDKIDKEIEKLNKQFENCCAFLEQEVYTIEVFKDRTNKIKDKIRILEENKKVLEKELKNDKVVKVKRLIPKLENVLKNYNTLSIEGKNELLRSIVKEAIYSKKKKCKKGSSEDYFELEITLNI